VVIVLFPTWTTITLKGKVGDKPIIKEKYKGYRFQMGNDSAIGTGTHLFPDNNLFVTSGIVCAGEDRFFICGYRTVPNLNKDNPLGQSWEKPQPQRKVQGLQGPERWWLQNRSFGVSIAFLPAGFFGPNISGRPVLRLVVIVLFPTWTTITLKGKAGGKPILKEKYKGYRFQIGNDSAIGAGTHFDPSQ
jgi:hypothetical protein